VDTDIHCPFFFPHSTDKYTFDDAIGYTRNDIEANPAEWQGMGIIVRSSRPPRRAVKEWR
jgi:hypothetical protein